MFSWNIGLYPLFQFTHKKSPKDLNYHIPKKHSAPKPDVTVMCKHSHQEFPGFHALRQDRTTQHGFPIKSMNIDPDNIINEVDDANLKEELRSCQQSLVESELERARYKVFNYAVETQQKNCKREI